METITVKNRRNEDLVISIHQEDGQIKEERVRGVRAGLSWPSSYSPGFYALVGQLWEMLPNGRRPLRLLKEGSNYVVGHLFQELTDAMGEFRSWEIFSDISYRYQNYVVDFYNFHKGRRLQNISLQPSPFFQSFGHRVFTIKKWIQEGSLYLGEGSTTREQLRNLKEEDLKGNIEEVLGGVNALGYVVSAFDVSDFSPQPVTPTPSKPPGLRVWR